MARALALGMGLGASAWAWAQATHAHDEPPALPQGTERPPQGAAKAGTMLDRALQVDTEAMQRNVDLLLETRELLPGKAQAGHQRPSMAAASAPTPWLDRDAPVREPGAASTEIPQVVRYAARFLREHRFWFLGLLGLLAVVMVAGRLWQRWRVGAAERRLRALAELQRPGHRRRRSSRH